MMIDKQVALHATFTARADTLTQAQRLIRDYAKRVRDEPGNLEFSVYNERDNPHRFFVFERYANWAAFQHHLSAEYGADFNAELGPLIEEDASRLTFLSGGD